MKTPQASALSYLKKAIRYCKKNGPGEAFYASLERMQSSNGTYAPAVLSQNEKEMQKSRVFLHPQTFSILVPAFETNPEHLKALLESVLCQTYKQFELIIADASRGKSVENVIMELKQSLETSRHEKTREISKKIIYYRLTKNGGISDNTNEMLKLAKGDYIGLLDHDDLLTPDALYEMQNAIEESILLDKQVTLLYSDEDKCDGAGNVFFEEHRKEKFNLDLIMSNNYICHFLVMRAGTLKELQFRKDYDGAQDYDLVLRYVLKLFRDYGEDLTISPSDFRLSTNINDLFRNKITHVSKTLYHWRCHTGSTAENPESKMYAYDAGLRAIESFLKVRRIKARVEHLKHLGFYRVIYLEDIFEQRKEVGILGGKIIKGNKIISGAFDENGKNIYEGINCHFSGYMHKAVLYQDVATVDLAGMSLRPELYPLFRKFFEMEPEELFADIHNKNGMYQSNSEKRAMLDAKNRKFCQEVRKLGYLIVWDPQWEIK